MTLPYKAVYFICIYLVNFPTWCTYRVTVDRSCRQQRKAEILFLRLFFFSQIRDDNKRQHPCLVDFSKLPETEKNYNLQMSTETLKYVEHYGLIFPHCAFVFEEKKKKKKRESVGRGVKQTDSLQTSKNDNMRHDVCFKQLFMSIN